MTGSEQIDYIRQEAFHSVESVRLSFVFKIHLILSTSVTRNLRSDTVKLIES